MEYIKMKILEKIISALTSDEFGYIIITLGIIVLLLQIIRAYL